MEKLVAKIVSQISLWKNWQNNNRPRNLINIVLFQDVIYLLCRKFGLSFWTRCCFRYRIDILIFERSYVIDDHIIKSLYGRRSVEDGKNLMNWAGVICTIKWSSASSLFPSHNDNWKWNDNLRNLANLLYSPDGDSSNFHLS